MSNTSQTLGQVKALTGEAFIQEVDGTLSTLHVGQTLYAGQMIIAEAGEVTLETPEGEPLTISGERMLLSDNLLASMVEVRAEGQTGEPASLWERFKGLLAQNESGDQDNPAQEGGANPDQGGSQSGSEPGGVPGAAPFGGRGEGVPGAAPFEGDESTPEEAETPSEEVMGDNGHAPTIDTYDPKPGLIFYGIDTITAGADEEEEEDLMDEGRGPCIGATSVCGEEDAAIPLIDQTFLDTLADFGLNIQPGTPILICGVPEGAVFFSNGANFNAAPAGPPDGQWEVTFYNDLTITPPPDSDVDFQLEFKLPDNCVIFTEVKVDAVADDAELTVKDVCVDEDGCVVLDITANWSDNDGSEKHILRVEIPDTWTVVNLNGWTAVTGDAGKITLEIEVTDPNGMHSGGPKVSPPTNSDVDAQYKVTAITEETPTDGGCCTGRQAEQCLPGEDDPSDNRTEVVMIKKIIVDAVADPVEIKDVVPKVPETPTQNFPTEESPTEGEEHLCFYEDTPIVLTVTGEVGDVLDGSENYCLFVMLPVDWPSPGDGWTEVQPVQTVALTGTQEPPPVTTVTYKMDLTYPTDFMTATGTPPRAMFTKDVTLTPPKRLQWQIGSEIYLKNHGDAHGYRKGYFR